MIEVIMMNEKKIPYSFINEKDVMDRLGGNTALFNRLFGKYMNSYRGAAEEVKKLIDEKKYSDARLLVHTIKGTSANLGISRMWELSAALEKTIILEEEEAILSRLDDFTCEMQNMIHEVDSL